MKRKLIVVAFAALMAVGCRDDVGPKPNLFPTPLDHACSDGSDQVGTFKGRPITRSFQDGKLYYCDEQDGTEDYYKPVGQ